MNANSKSKWRWRVLRWGLLALALLATLAAVLVTEENWRGKHAWEAYQRMREAQGERFDLASVIPPAVPDDENFFCAPVVAQALRAEAEAQGRSQGGIATPMTNLLDFNLYRGDSSKWPAIGGNWERGTLTELKPWQRYFRDYNATPEGRTNGFPLAAGEQTPAADILHALSAWDPAIEALRQAARRPARRLPLAYENGFDSTGDLLPWLALEKRWTRVLQLRSLAELDNGQGEPALQDIQLSFRLTDSLRDQPYLISHLVRLAMTAIMLQPVYEGLAAHRWDDGQLARLEDTLAAQDYLADFRLAMRGERTCAIDSFETQRLTRQMRSLSPENEIVTNSLRWMPAAYFYQNELAFARMYDLVVLPLVDVTNRTVSVGAYHAAEAASRRLMKHHSPYTVQALLLFPPVGQSVIKFALIQADVDLARTACALERYRLAHGEYPESLDALAPEFLAAVPHDLINGQPLHYRRTADGKFVLYSVGWNQTDDGGTVVLTKKGVVDHQAGDWVWKY